MHRRKWIIKVAAPMLFLVLVLGTMSGCEQNNGNTNNSSGNGNHKLETGGKVTSAGLALLEVDLPIEVYGVPVVKVFGVVLTLAGSYLMLDALFGDNKQAVPLSKEQRAVLEHGGKVEVVDESGNKKMVGRIDNTIPDRPRVIASPNPSNSRPVGQPVPPQGQPLDSTSNPDRPGGQSLSPPASEQSPLRPAPIRNIAEVSVMLPTKDAILVVNGRLIKTTGVSCLFPTPTELEPGKIYHYDLTVTWVEGVHTITEKRTIQVSARALTTVDFTRSARRSQP